MTCRYALAREMIAILGERGFAADIDLDGKHIKIRWLAGGKARMLVLAKSPSDRCASANARAGLLRILREEERRR